MNQIKRLFIDLSIICGTYFAWTILVIHGNDIPLPLLFLLGGYITCLHGSLQHIAVHGYPTRWAWLNTGLVYPPLAFYFPYFTYRDSHLQHHRAETLTDVETDPETLYLSQSHWNNLNSISKAVYRFNFTILGRLLIGPFVSLYRLWKEQARHIIDGKIECITTWFFHWVACLLILLFIAQFSALPIWKYLLCFVYPGISLTLLRSYTEHRWSNRPGERSIIVEGSPISRLLYLNNNYHWVHHENPGLPWQEVSRVFDQRRDEILQINGQFYYKGYFHMLSRLIKDRLIDPIHPVQAD